MVIALLMHGSGYSMELSSFESPGMEASLQIEHLDTDFNVGDSIVASRINRIGLILYESSYPFFQPGLQIGAFEINQNNNPVMEGINLTGNYFGVLFRSSLYRYNHTGMLLEGSYAYHSADKVLSDQEINLKWHEFLLKAYVLLSYGYIDFSFGSYSHVINGDETAFGVITRTRQFDEEENVGIHIGLDYKVDITGKIGIYADSGGGQGVGFLFTREF